MIKNKIINDPVYGFITFPSELIFKIIDHPYFQRLRRIKQLGLTDVVYPGANHTRFHHALGATYLMSIALDTLRNKNHAISEEEYEAALIAILLHDIGHGPFSHALEYGLLTNVTHEDISLILMKKLNEDFEGKLELAIQIFSNKYKRKFFHQLVSGQLDVDRLDYLNRDCYFTGVTEGQVSFDRILKMLNLVNDELVVEEKGIYSIENFLNARRLMYWQVYLHKTVISAEYMLLRIIQRAKELYLNNEKIFIPKSLEVFIKNHISIQQFATNQEIITSFILLDDNDIWYAIKCWQSEKDIVLSTLCSSLLNRNLFKINISNKEFTKEEIELLKAKTKKYYKIDNNGLDYLVIKGTISNNAYLSKEKNINILTKEGKMIDVAKAADLPNIKAMSKTVHKNFICWSKEIN